MVTKQVKEAGVELNSASNPPKTTEHSESGKSRTLYIKVDTYDAKGKQVGTRIVDMYHFGTRGWLQNHLWWAMHNGHTAEQTVAEPQDVDEYLAAQKQALAIKFNNERAHVAA